jgi:hypothetical protein
MGNARTARPAGSFTFQVRANVVDRLLHRGDLLGILVGNLGFEFLFECHDELNRVQRIGAKIIYERRLVLDLGFVDAELLGDDFLDSLLYVFHNHPPNGIRIVSNRRILPDTQELPRH